ncbi:hypothetical protein SADUNF_Sadunf18G0073500 [Salix dunnii]|uniref:Uncharacterized protein n=1 Tax=Salix dunnii TaxID=1413687 RepID=A0A835J3V2_9ROSI|nr:hypothetical protein SADUNF_Sadunf18G0073500 [Salix dunnii]
MGSFAVVTSSSISNQCPADYQYLKIYVICSTQATVSFSSPLDLLVCLNNIPIWATNSSMGNQCPANYQYLKIYVICSTQATVSFSFPLDLLVCLNNIPIWGFDLCNRSMFMRFSRENRK